MLMPGCTFLRHMHMARSKAYAHPSRVVVLQKNYLSSNSIPVFFVHPPFGLQANS